MQKEKRFTAAGGKEPYQGYDAKEIKLSTRRLTLYFTQLATKLIELKSNGDTEDFIKISIDAFRLACSCHG